MASRRLDIEYVLPLRWQDDSEVSDLSTYLSWLAGHADVTVVDGSPEEIFAVHAAAWTGLVRHLKPDPWPGRNGKVAGVVTGVRRARHEHVVIADDDVRYDENALTQVTSLLAEADLVWPQNYFDPLPWHARWDTARTLLNRALDSDYPGTFAIRRGTFMQMGGYDGDVLFENLELIRTVQAAGGVQRRAPEIFIARRPPSASHFWQQRVRQAYDDFAQPARLVVEVSILPILVMLLTGARSDRRGTALGCLAGLLLAAVGLSEVGRRKVGGPQVFPPTSALWAPAWVLERALCIWVAMGSRLRGGASYASGRIPVAAHSRRSLRRRVAHAVPLGPSNSLT